MNGIAGLLLVALVWGITNPFIKRGSAGLNTLRQNREYNRASGMSRVFKDLAFLARTPQYWIPLAVNLLGSVYFIIALANASKL